MIRYVFEELVDIRALREDRSGHIASLKRASLEQAQAFVEQCRHELDDYRVWKVGEKERLYGQVIRQVIHRDNLDQLKEMLAALDEKEVLLMQRIRAAEKSADEAKSEYDASRLAWQKARMNLQKLEEHKEVWIDAAELELARKEDVEMEEFGVHRLGEIGEEHES